MACGIFQKQGWNLCPLHWQVYSYPLDHQGSSSASFQSTSTKSQVLGLSQEVLSWLIKARSSLWTSVHSGWGDGGKECAWRGDDAKCQDGKRQGREGGGQQWLRLAPARVLSCPAPACLCVCISRSAVSDSLWPHGLWPIRLLCPWNSLGKHTGVDCHSLLQGIFPTQGLNPGLLHCRQILHHWETREAPDLPESLPIHMKGVSFPGS